MSALDTISFSSQTAVSEVSVVGRGRRWLAGPLYVLIIPHHTGQSFILVNDSVSARAKQRCIYQPE